MFSTEVTGNRVRDHYVRNIYIEISLKIVVRGPGAGPIHEY